MAPEDPTAELAEHQDTKDDEVLEREALEQELMQKDASKAGEEIESAGGGHGGRE